MSKTGVQLIADERDRQIAIENFDHKHDDEHNKGELTAAAECYAKMAMLQVMGLWSFEEMSAFASKSWPWNRESWKPSTDPIRNLSKSGALAAAEIDRLKRERGEC